MRVLSLLITQIEDSGLRDVIKVHECFGLASCGLCEFLYFQSITNKRVLEILQGLKGNPQKKRRQRRRWPALCQNCTYCWSNNDTLFFMVLVVLAIFVFLQTKLDSATSQRVMTLHMPDEAGLRLLNVRRLMRPTAWTPGCCRHLWLQKQKPNTRAINKREPRPHCLYASRLQRIHL